MHRNTFGFLSATALLLAAPFAAADNSATLASDATRDFRSREYSTRTVTRRC